MAGGLANGDGLETGVTLGAVVGVVVLGAGVTVAVDVTVGVGVPVLVGEDVGVPVATPVVVPALAPTVGVGVLAVAKSTAAPGALVGDGEPATVKTDGMPGVPVRLTVAVGVVLGVPTTWAWAGAGARRRQRASSQPEPFGCAERWGSPVAVALGVAVGTAVAAGAGVRVVDADEPAGDELGNTPVNRGSGGAVVGDGMTIGRAPLPSVGTWKLVRRPLFWGCRPPTPRRRSSTLYAGSAGSS
jgi:hypothetical protein